MIVAMVAKPPSVLEQRATELLPAGRTVLPRGIFAQGRARCLNVAAARRDNHAAAMFFTPG
ncbi:hypothetical protein [Roseomonas sp. 18066]|uniref:hypothetical protein n=1 Tax=Roseomonas sp. 18066 TaxID=2681412 RepID=UPI00135BFCDB|nr:hypothetical protein [Roseomonas sp. 18066]